MRPLLLKRPHAYNPCWHVTHGRYRRGGKELLQRLTLLALSLDSLLSDPSCSLALALGNTGILRQTGAVWNIQWEEVPCLVHIQNRLTHFRSFHFLPRQFFFFFFAQRSNFWDLQRLCLSVRTGLSRMSVPSRRLTAFTHPAPFKKYYDSFFLSSAKAIVSKLRGEKQSVPLSTATRHKAEKWSNKGYTKDV